MASLSAFTQESFDKQLSFAEYLGYVKRYHPLVRQANLQVSSAEAALMAARGAFDPKLEVDFDKKEFKGSEYYSVLKSSFKIPTWYGIEIKAGFDNSEGMYVNPQNVTPNSGLTSLGVTVPLGQGLVINSRMAELRAAKLQLGLGDAERRLQAANALYTASIAYFNWKKAYDEAELYETYVGYAETRYRGVRMLIEAGDKPAIDSIEAGIIVKSRRLSYEDALLKLAKARLEVSNFIWIDDVPVELGQDMVPQEDLQRSAKETMAMSNASTGQLSLEGHPKILALEAKRDILDVERRLKANLLLPKVNLSYNYLSEPSMFTDYRFEDYKIGLNFAFPLFLRKERGGLKLAKLKLQDAQLDLDLERVVLKNKVEAQQQEIISVDRQRKLIDALAGDYSQMLTAEERLFSVGESSIFLINTRENSLVAARLSQISMENRYLIALAALNNILVSNN